MVLLQAGMRSIWTHGGCVSSSLVSNISVILLKREAGPVHLFWGVWNSEKISIASQNCVPITLDNPQTSLSTLSIWTTFYWRNSFSENGWHSVLWLIQSSWGTVSGKRYFIEIFKAIFLLLLFFVFFCKPHKQNSICFYCIWEKGRNPRGRYLSLTTWANKIQIFCLAELIQIGLCVDLSIKFKWFLKRP